MKKKMMAVMVMTVAVLFIAGSAFAFGRCGGIEKDGKNCPQGKEMRREMAKDLGLTPDQEKLLDAQKEASRNEGKALHDAMKAKKSELQAAIAKPGATRAQVEPIVAELKALESQMVEKRVNGIFAVKAILTPEQFAKLEAMKEKHMKDWKGKRKGNGPEKGR